jgi:hypothetical protein
MHEWCFTRTRMSPTWAEGFAEWPTMHNDSFALTLTRYSNKHSLRQVSVNNGAKFYRMFHNCGTISNFEIFTQLDRPIFTTNGNPDAPTFVQSKRMASIFVMWSHYMQWHFAFEHIRDYILSQKLQWFSIKPTGRSWGVWGHGVSPLVLAFPSTVQGTLQI